MKLATFASVFVGRDAHARRNANPAQNTLPQLSRQCLDFPASELAKVQETFVDRIVLHNRHYRAENLRHSVAEIAIKPVITGEEGDVFALDEVANLEGGVTHPHPKQFGF